MIPAPGSHLTVAQLDYLRSEMRPCGPELVASATEKVMWHDSDDVLNVAHCGPSGAVIPVVAREVTLVLRRALAADTAVHTAVAALSDQDRATMAATTTDRDPIEILNVGFETTARALVQHAYVATPYATPAEFARGLRDSGVFAVVANTWFWGLQSSTFRRGMLPVVLEGRPDGTLRYTSESSAMLRAMKDATIARAHTSGIPVRYAAIAELPRCLANMSVQGVTVLPRLVDAFVETFVRLLDVVPVGMETTMSEVFEVPDMTCSHCTDTITSVLASEGVAVSEIDLTTKKVVAAFPTTAVRDRCFTAIRDRGYTVVPT
ncbi:heavy-metal-associated domain-containing protein [Kribbella sp. NPDC055071]